MPRRGRAPHAPGGRRGGRAPHAGRAPHPKRSEVVADPQQDEGANDAINFISNAQNAKDPLVRLQALFMAPAEKVSFVEHKQMATQFHDLYATEFLFMLHSVDVSRPQKVMVLVVAFELRDFALIDCLLSDTVNYTLPEVLGACRVLDSNRRMASLAKKMAVMRKPEIVAAEEQMKARASEDAAAYRHPKRQRNSDDASAIPRRVLRTVSKLHKFQQELVDRGKEHVPELTATLCGANAAVMCRWAYELSAEDLKHFMLEFGLEMWKQLSDLIHINPTKMKFPCFLPFAFKDIDDEKLPEDVRFSVQLKKETPPLSSVLNRVVTLRVSYTLLRKLYPPHRWTDAEKAAVATYTDITTVLWWLEDLQCAAVEKIIIARLQRGEAPKFGYGKLMERLMCCSSLHSAVLPVLIPFAERSMKEYTLPLRTPMAVLGDCSGSMQVAVRTASIIVSLLTALGQAHLNFFNSRCVPPPFLPRTIKEVLVCTDEVVADGSTAPAAALEPLFFAKVPLETIIVVTDEKENDPGPRSHLHFHELVAKYRAEVSPNVTVVFVSFLGPSEAGDMATKLASVGIPFLQCRLNGARPDLTKFDMLLGKMSMATPMHGIASHALALYVRTRSQSGGESANMGRDVGSFAADFVRGGGRTLLGMLETTIKTCNDEAMCADLHHVLGDFFAAVRTAPAVTAARDFLSRPESMSLSSLKSWAAGSWGFAFKQEVEESTMCRTGEEVWASPGTLRPVPKEVLLRILQFLPLNSFDDVSRACSQFALLSSEAKFDVKLTQKEGLYDKQLHQIQQMGLLDIFTVEDVSKILLRTNGNVEHAVALLFGEGQGGGPAPHGHGRGAGATAATRPRRGR